MKTNGVPAIVMLTAGFLDCIIAIRSHLSLFDFTKQLLLVLLLFYIIGCVVKVILDRNFKDMEEKEDGEPDESENGEEENEEKGSPKEEAVSDEAAEDTASDGQ